MEGHIDPHGNCVIKWNPMNGEGKLYSPDGTQHCLPCDHCGNPQWVSLATCAVLCDQCARDKDEDGDGGPPYDAATATGMYDYW